MGSLIAHILAVPGALVYVLVGLIVFAEDALFVGFVIPGETAAVLGGVDASRGHVSLWLMIALVVVAAIVGDTVGYAIGRQVGPRIPAGGVIWGTGFVLLGFLAGNSYAAVEKAIGRGVALAVLGLVLLALLTWRIRRHRAERGSPDRPAS